MTENGKNTTKMWQPLVYAVLLVVGIAGGYFLQNNKSGGIGGGNGKIGEVMRLING